MKQAHLSVASGYLGGGAAVKGWIWRRRAPNQAQARVSGRVQPVGRAGPHVDHRARLQGQRVAPLGNRLSGALDHVPHGLPGVAEGHRGASGLEYGHAHRPVARAHTRPDHRARLVVWPGIGAHTANMNYVRLAPGEENVPHSHAESEDTIVILSGRGTVDDLTNGAALSFEAGDMIHVPVGLEHRVKADRGEAVESVGGPCPPDTAMLALSEEA